MINIITRFSRKDIFLEKCLKSLKSQTHQEYHHIITFEKEKDREFLTYFTDPEKTTLCKVFPQKKLDGLYKSYYYRQHFLFDDINTIDPKLWNIEEGEIDQPDWEGGRVRTPHFPYNLYMIQAEKKVKEGWILYLDDDDEFIKEDSLEILHNRQIDEDTLYVHNLYKEDEGLVYPRPIAIEHSITVYNEPPALGIGFASSVFTYHSKYLEYTAWDEWYDSDWRTFQSLWYNISKKEYINDVLINVPNSNGGMIF
jgi:hypothetical protein